MTDLVGYAAATLGTFVMLPQLWKTIQTRSAHDVSTVMLVVYLLQNILWFTYGMLILSVPLIACNVVAFGLAAVQMALKVKFESMRSPAN
jgi:MtN3 and saliva related transmembrane protein